MIIGVNATDHHRQPLNLRAWSDLDLSRKLVEIAQNSSPNCTILRHDWEKQTEDFRTDWIYS